MKVYEFDYNADKFQSFMRDGKEDDLANSLAMVFRFDGTSKKDVWKQPKCLYIANPMKERGNFFHLGCQIAMDQHAFTVLKDIMDVSCELLPFTFENETYYAINIINVIDCYDYEKGVYEYWNDGKADVMIGVKKYVFKPSNFNENSVFKDNFTMVRNFTYEGFLPNPEKEFKYLYEKHGLKGLTFRLLWDSEMGY